MPERKPRENKPPKSGIRVLRERHNPFPKPKKFPAAKNVSGYHATNLKVGNAIVPLVFRFKRGKGDPIVFLPGLGCSQLGFKRIFSDAAFKGCTVLTIDFPGLGGAPAARNFSYSMDSLVELTKAITERFGLKRAILVGHSMGGVVATLFAEKYPQTLSALVSIEGLMQPAQFSANRPSALEHFYRSIQQTNQAAGNAYRASLHEAYEKGRLLEKFLSPKTARIKRVYVFGSDNRHYPWLEALRGNAELIEVPDAGHWAFEDNPNFFFSALATALKKT